PTMAAVAPAPPADCILPSAGHHTVSVFFRLGFDAISLLDGFSPSGVQYDSANGGELPMALIPTGERSLTPLLQEHMDASMSYIPNGYAASFYYGG
ncbi:hypothetical protein BHE74_00047843, partial [Ensete ventricosum]